MNTRTKRMVKGILIVLCSMIFILCIEHVFAQKTIEFDQYVYSQVAKLTNPTVTLFFKIVTEFGNLPAFLGITAAASMITKKRKYFILILSNLGVVGILNQCLKLLFVRPRPLHLALIKETGYSFPSGHAMASVAFYGFLIYILWQTKQEKSVKIIVTVLLSILVFLIGISRIYLGVHYASDILAGFSLSVIYLIIMTNISKAYL